MNYITAHKLKLAARRWAKEGARANPGIKFLALVDGQCHTAEVGPGLYDTFDWRQDMELGFKDGASGRWVWDSELDGFTQLETEETP